MPSKLKLISYNCQSLNAKSAIIANLLKECDVLCLQETLIDKNNSYHLDQFDNNFSFEYEPAYRNSSSSRGRSSGGLSIFWRGAKDITFKPLFFDKRIMGLKVTFNGGYSILILNIYFICDYDNIDSLLEYMSTIATLENITKTENYNELFIVGDFNADPNKGRFYNQLKSFYENNMLYATDILALPPKLFLHKFERSMFFELAGSRVVF